MLEIYVQARMGSTRLPGKVLKTILKKPLLEFLIERLEKVTQADGFCILTTTNKEDDAIVNFCEERKVKYYRGPDEDVLARYYQVAQKRRPDAIVRITSDCPLIDPAIIDEVISAYKEAWPQFSYVSNGLERTYPRGMDVEVFSFDALEEAALNAKNPEEREHVTPYIYRHPETFCLCNVSEEKDLSDYRLTVDTIEDFELIRLILEDIYPINPTFNLQDIMRVFKEHPDWKLINAHIKQKNLSY